MAPEITVDYLGGDPDVATAPVTGKLTLSDGSFAFAGAYMVGVKATSVNVTIPESEVRALSLGDANHMRGLTRGATGMLLGGAIGGLVGLMTGKRNLVLAVDATRGGFDFVAAFACAPDDGRWFVNELQRGRRDRGLDQMPKIEDLAGQEARAAADSQSDVMARILAQLEQQTELLRAIAERAADA